MGYYTIYTNGNRYKIGDIIQESKFKWSKVVNVEDRVMMIVTLKELNCIVSLYYTIKRYFQYRHDRKRSI